MCGANLIIVTGYGSYGHYPSYGCSQHFNRGACSNAVLIRRDWVEERLLDDLQNQVLKREAIDYVLEEFGRHLKDAFAKLSGQLAQMRERKQKLGGELKRLAATAAETGPSSFLVAAIHEREQQLREITDQLLARGTGSVDSHLSDIRRFVTQRLGDLRGLLTGQPAEARRELLKHVSEIRMVPQAGDGKPHYVAEGRWNLLGNEKDSYTSQTLGRTQIRMVAGVGFEPTTFGL